MTDNLRETDNVREVVEIAGKEVTRRALLTVAGISGLAAIVRFAKADQPHVHWVESTSEINLRAVQDEAIKPLGAVLAEKTDRLGCSEASATTMSTASATATATPGGDGDGDADADATSD